MMSWEPEDKNEKVAIDLGNKSFLGPSNAYFNLLGGQISGDALVTLDTTGTLKYTFRATEGDFLRWPQNCMLKHVRKLFQTEVQH